jgi:cysteine desulfurase
VLKAMGISDELAHSTLRITLGRFTTHNEITTAGAVIKQAILSFSKMR